MLSVVTFAFGIYDEQVIQFIKRIFMKKEKKLRNSHKSTREQTKKVGGYFNNKPMSPKMGRGHSIVNQEDKEDYIQINGDEH